MECYYKELYLKEKEPYMIIELENEDLSYIEKINEDLKANEDIPLLIGKKGKRYFIEFICEDVAKANNFAAMLMNPKREKVQELNDKFGISIKSLNFCIGDSKTKELKKYLKAFIEKLEAIE